MDQPVCRTLGGRLADVLVVALAAVLPIGLHRSYISEDGELPWEDAPGHLVILMRWYEALFQGRPPPADPYPPGLYSVASVCLHAFGARLPAAQWAVVLFASALAAALAVIGLRLQGRTAGLLLPALVCAAPSVSIYSRMFLLEVPATAALAWVAVAVVTCDGFRRSLPTIGLGLALAATALTKYPFLIWAPAMLVAPFVVMLRRAPASMLVLAGFAVPIGWVLQRLAERMDGGGAVDVGACLQVLGLSGGLGVIAWSVLAWRRLHPSLLPGLRLGLAAVLALALVTPWLALAGATLGENVIFNVVEKDRPGIEQNLETAWVGLKLAWPWTAAALAAGGGLALVELVARRWFPLARGFGVDRSRGPVIVPVLVAAAVAASGAWVTAASLMPNNRYYLPLYPIAAVVIGVPVARLVFTRWLAGPALAAVCAVQLLAAADLYEPPASVTFEMNPLQPSHPSADGVFFVPRDRYPWGPRAAVERALSVLKAQFVASGCGGIGVRRSRGDLRSIPALAVLHGFDECDLDGDPRSRTTPRGWLLVALPPADIERIAPAVSEGGGWRVVYEETLADTTRVSARLRER
jgi:hypothetical protein